MIEMNQEEKNQKEIIKVLKQIDKSNSSIEKLIDSTNQYLKSIAKYINKANLSEITLDKQKVNEKLADTTGEEGDKDPEEVEVDEMEKSGQDLAKFLNAFKRGIDKENEREGKEKPTPSHLDSFGDFDIF